jgi:hypothetical protein
MAILAISTIASVSLTFQANSSPGLKSRLNFINFDQSRIQDLVLSAFSRNLISSGQIVRCICLLIIFAMMLNFIIFFFLSKDWLSSITSDSSQILLLEFSVYSLISSAIFVTFSGGIVDEYFSRYFLTSILMMMIFTSVFCVQIYSVFGKRFLNNTRLGTLLAIALLFLSSFSGWNLQSPNSQYDLTAKCLKDLRAKGIDLNAGVSDYWFGRSIDYLSSSPNRTYVALNTLDPFYWMTTDSYYNSSARYNYILLHTKPDQFNFNKESMQNFLPPPSMVYECQETDMDVYHYDNDSLDLLVRDSINKYLKTFK